MYLITVAVSWIVHDTAHIISTKIAKKKLLALPGKKNVTDRSEMLLFQSFMYYWVCYECLKVLSIFGLRPVIRDDISDWSKYLNGLFVYYLDKIGNENYRSKANKPLTYCSNLPSMSRTSENFRLEVKQNLMKLLIQSCTWLF